MNLAILNKLYHEAGCNETNLCLWKQGYCHALKDLMEMEE